VFEIGQAITTGVSHLADGSSCQDAVATAATVSGGAVLAVADGAGSRPLSQHGATAAASDAVAFALRNHAAAPAQTIVVEALRAARRAAEERATSLGVALEEIACTLSVAVIEKDMCAVAAVGDGVHVVRFANGDLRPVAMGEVSDFANLTHFLTQDEYESHLVVDSFPARDVDAMALSSDGLDSLFLYGPLDARWVYRPLADRFLDADGRGLSRLLASDAVAARCHDDLSVAVARRVRSPGAVARVATLSDGRDVYLDPDAAIEWPGGHKAWPVVDLCGSYLVQPARALRADTVEILARPPQCWTARSPLPLISWPLAAALDDNWRPWALLIRDPGGRPGADAETAKESVHVFHRAGYAHGALRTSCFRADPATATACLVDPLPAFVAGDDARRRRTDERFLGAPAPEPGPTQSARRPRFRRVGRRK
jgi:Protein phosphatase 2C